MTGLAQLAADVTAEPDVQTYGIWGLASAVVTGVVFLVSKLIERRTGPEVLREDADDSADNAKILTDIARGMVEDIAKRLEVVENELARVKADSAVRESKWRESWHLMQVWVSQTQEAARLAGITLPTPPDSPMEH